MNLDDVEEILITKVQVHEMLWNSKHKHHKNTKLRNEIWRMISTDIGVPGRRLFSARE
jgi:hypothetical protein